MRKWRPLSLKKCFEQEEEKNLKSLCVSYLLLIYHYLTCLFIGFPSLLIDSKCFDSLLVFLRLLTIEYFRHDKNGEAKTRIRTGKLRGTSDGNAGEDQARPRV